MSVIRDLLQRPLSSTLDAVRRASTNKTIQVAFWMGSGGVALALANLLFAGILSSDDFGRLSLFQAILSVGVGVGPLGFDNLAARRQLRPAWSDFILAGSAAVLVAGILTLGAFVGYELPTSVLALILLGCAGGSVGKISGGYDQALVRLNRAQIVIQSTFVFFLIGALAFFFLKSTSWVTAAGLLTGGYLISGFSGAFAFARNARQRKDDEFLTTRLSFSEKWTHAFMLVAIAVSTHVLLQLERLVIPRALSLEDLATFTVAWTLVGSPYKLLQSGTFYSLLPRLRTAESISARRRLIANELKSSGGLGILAGAVLLVLGVPLVEWLYGSKYAVDFGLVAVILISGLVRIIDGVGHATVVALGERPKLNYYNWCSWGAMGAAAGAAFLLGSFSLEGLILGATIGWALRVPAGFGLVRSSLMMPSSETVEAPADDLCEPSGGE